MVPKKKLVEQVTELLKERAHKALQLAKKSALREDLNFPPLKNAMHYFIEDWLHASHPTLLSLTCEAVGGDPNATTRTAAALVLIAGAADVHDDIIDQSTTKDARPTVFGKFGRDITILLGDALLFKGLLMLHEACEPLMEDQKRAILGLTKQAFFELGNAEALEASLRGQLDLCPDEYQNIIRKKVSVAEAAAKMGVILGNGSPEEVERLGRYGRTLGFLMTIRDEFIDVFEPEELKNRFENECLPLPVLNAFQESARKKKILQLLERKKITQDEMDKILDLVINAKENCKLGKYMWSLIEAETQRLTFIKVNYYTFVLMLQSTLQDIPYKT